MPNDYAKVARHAAELGAAASSLGQIAQSLADGVAHGEPLTATQKANIRKRLRTAVDDVRTSVTAIEAEVPGA